MLEEIIILISITLLAMASPGPDLLLLLRNGISHGKAVGFATVLGICTGLTFHVTLAVLGLAIIIAQNIYIYQAIKFLGAGYLIYLGFCALRSPGQTSVAIQREQVWKSLRKGFRDGIFCNLLNPKVTLFILSIFTQLISPQAPSHVRTIYAGVIVCTSFFGWSLFVLVMQTSMVQRALERSKKAIDYLFGGFMVALGLRIFFMKYVG